MIGLISLNLMRKLLILFIILIPNTSFSNEKFVNYLKEGKKIIL